MFQRIGQKGIHISLIVFPVQKKETTEPINCFSVSHRFWVKPSAGGGSKLVSLRGVFQPNGRRTAVEGIAHLLTGKWDSTVDPFEDVQTRSLGCSRI